MKKVILLVVFAPFFCIFGHKYLFKFKLFSLKIMSNVELLFIAESLGQASQGQSVLRPCCSGDTWLAGLVTVSVTHSCTSSCMDEGLAVLGLS